jgi:peptidoglycan hydrolase CwlO-like protein
MWKRISHRHKLQLHAYSILCAGLISGCATGGGSFNLGQADAQISNLAQDYPEIAKQLQQIRIGVDAAQRELAEKEKTIDNLAQSLREQEQKAKERLTTIWKLTSAILGLLLVVGGYLAWKLK